MREVTWKNRQREVVSHTVYTQAEADTLKIKYVSDWRKGLIGDWVLTDDECVVQILRRYENLKGSSILLGTCTTQVNAMCKTHKLDTEKKHSRYTIGGGVQLQCRKRNLKRLDSAMLQFCSMVANGTEPNDAYIQCVYKPNTGRDVLNTYIIGKVNKIMAQRLIQEQLEKNMGELLEQEGISKQWILQQYKRIILHGDKDAPKVVALNKLSQFQGMDNAVVAPEPLPQLPEGVMAKFLNTAGEEPAQVEAVEVEEPKVDLTGNSELLDRG
jgi:hypothetical protein